MNEAVDLESALLLERYRNIQGALIRAVREVHLKQGKVPPSTRKIISETMQQFEWVFTTSYDLASVPVNRVPVYFLHGALHLVTGSSGATWKLRQTDLDSILNQFGKPIRGDAEARPLLVTEGSAGDKLTAIEDNVYLSHALNRLRQRDLPVVVFGSSLSEHDAHLAEALSEHPERPVAISMLPAERKRLLAAQVDICGRLEARPLLFFDATTHPAG